MNIKAKRDIADKTKILNHALEGKNVAKICRYLPAHNLPFWTSMYSLVSSTVSQHQNITLRLLLCLAEK